MKNELTNLVWRGTKPQKLFASFDVVLHCERTRGKVSGGKEKPERMPHVDELASGECVCGLMS